MTTTKQSPSPKAVAAYGFKIKATTGSKAGYSVEMWVSPMAYSKALKAAKEYAKELGFGSPQITMI